METSDLFCPIFITEQSRNLPIIVVDVQPAYQTSIDFNVWELADLLNRHNGKILMFTNAEVEGLTEDTQQSIMYWWHENGLDVERIWDSPNFTYFDKGYGYMRAWMDQGTDPAAIITAIRFLFQNKEYDSRDIDEEVWEELLGGHWDYFMENDPLIVNWVGIDLLRQHQGYICGGGKNECLREVTLMMNAFNLKYKMIERFIYG